MDYIDTHTPVTCRRSDVVTPLMKTVRKDAPAVVFKWFPIFVIDCMDDKWYWRS